MFCPECEGEFREGITSCPDCEVDLVDALPEPAHDHREFVSVFETGDPALLPVARSLLDGAGMKYVAKGEETLGIFPGLAGGLAVDPKAHAAQILVPPDRADEARELLSRLEEDAGDHAPDED